MEREKENRAKMMTTKSIDRLMVIYMNRGKRSRHGSAVVDALAQAATTQPPVIRSSHAENTPEGAGQATPAQPRVTQSSHVDSMPEQVAEFGKRTIFLEGLVLQLAERVGIDPSIIHCGDGSSVGAREATSEGGGSFLKFHYQ
ncbi:hypothetical protein MRB53_020566 [Persea americana]|uniref:Uncharacterized protein n=1 Tax=Persea americana TaxID=3435 RepID=A0ACC2L1D0_PERAE|nr:hypothetical protein MRB53_020566 [Persea americana]